MAPHGLLLFDLANDPGETTNLSADNPDKVAEMIEAAKIFQAALGDVPPKIELGRHDPLTPDLKGAQPPNNISQEYLEEEVAKRLSTIDSASRGEAPEAQE